MSTFVFVVVSLFANISPELRVRSSPNFRCITHGRGSVLVRWRCDTLSISDFMNDVIFARNAHSGLYAGESMRLQRVTSLCRLAQANAPVASYRLCRFFMK